MILCEICLQIPAIVVPYGHSAKKLSSKGRFRLISIIPYHDEAVANVECCYVRANFGLAYQFDVLEVGPSNRVGLLGAGAQFTVHWYYEVWLRGLFCYA